MNAQAFFFLRPGCCGDEIRQGNSLARQFMHYCDWFVVVLRRGRLWRAQQPGGVVAREEEMNFRQLSPLLQTRRNRLCLINREQ